MEQDQTAMDQLKVDGEWCFGVNCESDLEFQDVVRWCHEVYGNVAIKGSYSKDMYITKLVGLRGASLTISDQLIAFNNNTISYERWHQIVNPKNDAAEPSMPKNKYLREIKPGVFVDVYDVLKAYEITCPAMQHAVKKCLAAGQRGVKDSVQDMKEAIASIDRSIELEQENRQQP